MTFNKLDFKTRREELNLTQEDVAAAVRVSVRTVANWDAGLGPTKKAAVKVAEYFLKVQEERLGKGGTNNNIDLEKETLRELVEAQKQLLTHWREIMLAQMLRSEAIETEILYRVAALEGQVDPLVKKKNVLQIHESQEQAKEAVEERLQKLKNRKPAGV